MTLRHSFRHRHAAAACVAVILTAGVLPPDVRRAEPAPGSASGTAAAPTASHGPGSALDRLLSLADTIHGVAADGQVGDTYLHYRRWVLGRIGDPPPRPDTVAVYALDVQVWDKPDGSGRWVYAQTGPDYNFAGVHPGDTDNAAAFDHAGASTRNYPAGTQHSPFVGPLSAQPYTLAWQLVAADPWPSGPQAALREVDDLFMDHYVDLPVRRAVLRVLAGIPGLTFREGVRDRMGRLDDAVSLTADRTEYTLVFDPATGVLFASQQRGVDGYTYGLAVPPGLLWDYTLFVSRGHRPANPR